MGGRAVTRGRGRVCLIVLTLLPAVPVAADAGGPVHLPGCERVVASPTFRTDGTAFCAGTEYRASGGVVTKTVRVSATHDHARSWKAVAVSGLPQDDTASFVDIVISPAFAEDRMLAIDLGNAGVYFSRDAAVSFQAAPLVTGPVIIVAAPGGILDAPAPVSSALPSRHGLIVGVGRGVTPGLSRSIAFDPVLPNIRVLAGTDAIDQAFFASPDYATDGAAFAVGADGTTPTTTRHGLYACAAEFACRTKLFTFPPAEWVDRLTFAPDYAKTGTLFATTIDLEARQHAYVSYDRGVRFTRMAMLDGAMAEVYRTGATGALALAAGRPGSRTVLARISGGVPDPQPAGERLYRSDDDGRHWRLVAFGRPPYIRGSRGTVPYSLSYSAKQHHQTPLGVLTIAPDGRVLANARRPSIAGLFVWCSPDAGIHWTTTCH